MLNIVCLKNVHELHGSPYVLFLYRCNHGYALKDCYRLLGDCATFFLLVPTSGTKRHFSLNNPRASCQCLILQSVLLVAL